MATIHTQLNYAVFPRALGGLGINRHVFAGLFVVYLFDGFIVGVEIRNRRHCDNGKDAQIPPIVDIPYIPLFCQRGYRMRGCR